MSMFWEKIKVSNVFIPPSQESYNSLLVFADNYMQNLASYISRLLKYIVNEDDYLKIDGINKILINPNNDLHNKLFAFVAEISKYVPNALLIHIGWYDNYKLLLNYIKKYLDELEILKYSDVNDLVEKASNAGRELHCLEQCIIWCNMENINKNNRKKFDFTNIDISANIEEIVSYFEKIFNDSSTNSETDRINFDSFFNKLQYSKDIYISKSNLDRIHNLITLYSNKYGYPPDSYRRILINISRNNTLQ